jgi:hypothetical protein
VKSAECDGAWTRHALAAVGTSSASLLLRATERRKEDAVSQLKHLLHKLSLRRGGIVLVKWTVSPPVSAQVF